MSLSSLLLSPESALRFPSSLGKGRSKCWGRAAAFVGAELPAKRHLLNSHRHGGITQSYPSCKPGPSTDRLQIWEFFEQKGFGDTRAAASLSSAMASKQLSARHKDTGLNIALPVHFPTSLDCGMPPIGFGFDCKVPHITDKT